ncbi:MAG: helix-turn-helix domain-containing protein [Chloroflexi bacterium]|nr:helix-turn-helix domain-containing protein [Chloroflexota bacterium]
MPHLEKIVCVGSNKAKVITRAHILLKSDEGKTDKEIAALLYIGEATVRRTRQRFWCAGTNHAAPGRGSQQCGLPLVPRQSPGSGRHL